MQCKCGNKLSWTRSESRLDTEFWPQIIKFCRYLVVPDYSALSNTPDRTSRGAVALSKAAVIGCVFKILSVRVFKIQNDFKNLDLHIQCHLSRERAPGAR